MSAAWICFISLLFGAVSALSAVGAGFLFMPFFIGLLHLSSTTAAALGDCLNSVTTFTNLAAEEEYKSIHYFSAVYCVLWALPGTLIGTLVSGQLFLTEAIWGISLLTSIILILFSGFELHAFLPKLNHPRTFASSVVPHTFAPSVVPRTFAPSVVLCSSRWWLPLLGLASSTTGAPVNLILVPWLRGQYKLPLHTAVPTAQMVSFCISSISLLEHLETGVLFGRTEYLILVYAGIAAWYGGKIAHFYSVPFTRFLYAAACLFSGGIFLCQLFR